MYDSEIEGEDGRLTAAQATFEQERGRLYRGDGQPLYGEAEHKEQMAAILYRLDAAIDGAQEVAGRITTEQQTQIAHLTHGDTLDFLDTVQKMDANTRMAFAKEDAETLTPAELVMRCQIALTGSDKAAQYLLARYVGRRVAAAVEVARAVAPTASAPTGDPAWLTVEQREELAGLVDQLSGKVRGSEGLRKAEEARARVTRAQELRAKTVALYDAAHGLQARVRAGLIASGRYSI